MWFGVLGHLAVRRGDGADVPVTGPARRQVLAALLCRAGAIVRTDTLVEDLWGSAPPRSAVGSLRSHIVRLRTALAQGGGEGLLVTVGDGYRLDIAPEDVDAGRFESLVNEANRTSEPASAIALYEQALALWRDEAYVEFGDAPFAVLERIRLGELRAQARDMRTDLALAEGVSGELIGDLEQRVRTEPYRERGWEQLALALYRAGRQADALNACRRARQVLLDDLGVDPGATLQMLEQQLLHQDPQLLATARRVLVAPPILDRCPYLGLAGYLEQDAALFVGRERLTSVLAGRLADQSVVVVTGASGVGKSSLVRAGLVPALRAGAVPGSSSWRIDVRTPGAAVLADQQRRPDLLVLDQAEELFTRDGTTQHADLVHRLARYVENDRGRMVLVLRSDFYGRLADVPALAPYAQSNAVLVGPMRADELRRALVEPADRAGLQLEDELIETIMDDVAGQPEPLPLLSEAMVRTWERRTSDRLTLAGYEQAGELAGALEAAAEECYLGLGEAAQPAARQLLVRMAARGDTGWVRRPVTVTGSLDDAEQQALAGLVAARLVVADDQHIEISHEALFAHWPRLRDWLDERRLAADLLAHLEQAADEWRAAGHRDPDLYRGPRLSAALDWRAGHAEDLSAVEHQFLDASERLADAELTAVRRRTRRLRTVIAVLAVAVVMAATAAGIAARERSNASQAALTALANSLGGQSVGEPNLDLAMLLAVEGEKLHPSLQTEGALLKTVLRAPALIRIFNGDGLRVNGMALSPDGRTLALEDNVPNIFFFDTATGQRTGEMRDAQLDAPPSALAFTPQGQLLFFGGGGSTPNAIDFINPATETVTRRLALPGAVLASVQSGGPSDPVGNFGGKDFALAGDGGRLAVAVGRYVLQWTLPQGRLSVPPLRVGNDAGAVYYTPDQSRLLVLGSRTTRLFNARTGRLLRTYSIGGATAAVSPDGRTFVVGDDAGTLRFLTLSTGSIDKSLAAHPGGVSGVDFNPDGQQVITSGYDRTSRVWDLASHRVVQTFAGHAANITGQSISEDGATLYTASSDGTVLAWDLAGRRGLYSTFIGVHNRPEFSSAFAFSPDGRAAAVAGTNGIVNLWSLRPLHREGSFRAEHGLVAALSFSPDGHSLLVAGDGDPTRTPGGGSLRIWTLRPQPHITHDLHGFWRTLWASYSPDGKTVAATGSPGDAPGGFAQGGHGDGLVGEWDAITGKRLATPVRLRGNGEAVGAGFANRGTTLSVAQLGNWAAVVDPARHRILRRWKASTAQYLVAAVLAPDGTRLATADWDGYVRIWTSPTAKQTLPRIRVSEGNAESLVWSPDGSRLLTSGGDGSVGLYDARTGQQIGASITPGSDTIAAAVYSPDGTTIAITDYSGRVWLYPATVAGWIRYACQAANRNLTRAEWRQYVPGHEYRPVCSTKQ